MSKKFKRADILENAVKVDGFMRELLGDLYSSRNVDAIMRTILIAADNQRLGFDADEDED